MLFIYSAGGAYGVENALDVRSRCVLLIILLRIDWSGMDRERRWLKLLLFVLDVRSRGVLLSILLRIDWSRMDRRRWWIKLLLFSLTYKGALLR